MSSFIRRIERQVHPSRPRPFYQKSDGSWHLEKSPPRGVFYQGRGSKLGVCNPKDKALIARLKREQRNAERREAITD